MERWCGRVALVTGASAGIGACLVKELTKYGLNVAACARNFDRLQSLQKELAGNPGQVLPIKCDVRDEKQILAMFDQIQKQLGRLDICINNAGLAFPARLSEGTSECWREMLDVNVLALSICTREALKLMKANNIKDGHIVHISSMSGYRLERGNNGFYACTKHAVKALTEGLRLELNTDKSDIRITSISPGNVDTEFTARMYRHDGDKIKEVTSKFKELESQDIADAVVYALSAPPHVQIFDILMRPNHQPT